MVTLHTLDAQRARDLFEENLSYLMQSPKEYCHHLYWSERKDARGTLFQEAKVSIQASWKRVLET
jgi:hypothetical protein